VHDDPRRDASRLLPAKSSEALRAGSTGLFDPAGISPFQGKACRTLAEAEGREYLGLPSPTRPPQKRAAQWIIHSPLRWYRRSVHRARIDESRAGHRGLMYVVVRGTRPFRMVVGTGVGDELRSVGIGGHARFGGTAVHSFIG
jgi:hypothetical protein